MPKKIVFIGAGSHSFTRTLVRDLLTFPLLNDAEIALVDINKEKLDAAVAVCKRIISAGGYGATVTATTDRRKALGGADAVLTTILCGDVDHWKHDILIPKKFGVDTNVGDTRSVSGIFRALRTIPEMLAICRDIEELCPQALLLNYTNPMAMLCQAMLKTTKVNVTGLCHSVQGTAAMLAGWAGVPFGELDYLCAGINHLSWYLKLEHKGEDIYPILRNKVRKNKRIYNEEQVRNELFIAFDYYVTESSGHNSEYNWWFRKREDLIEKYCTHGTGWNPGEYAYIVKGALGHKKHWKKGIDEWLKSPDWDDPDKLEKKLKRGEEYASPIINAWVGGDIFKYNGNVLNTGNLVENLPSDCCVEVPVLAGRRFVQPMHVGSLPAQVAPLTSLQAQVETMAVDAALTGDARLVYQAICNDPLSAAKLSLDEIRRMVKAMFRKNKNFLPTFTSLDF
jgi:alpha-galactosidase